MLTTKGGLYSGVETGAGVNRKAWHHRGNLIPTGTLHQLHLCSASVVSTHHQALVFSGSVLRRVDRLWKSKARYTGMRYVGAHR